MSIDYDEYISSSDSNITYQNCIEYARITCNNKNSYSMKTERITIGRNSTDGSVDIDVGPQTFVSRKHLEVTYSFQKLKVKCLGKNGIFINKIFKEHSHIAYELPQECTLRFPSTDVEVTVQQLAGRSMLERDKSRRDNIIEQSKGTVKWTGVCVRTQGEAELDDNLYLSKSAVNERHTFIDSEHGQETQKDMEIYSKYSGKRSSSAKDIMDQCSVRIQNVPCSSMEKRNVMSPQIIINPRTYRSYSCSSDLLYNGQIFGAPIDPKDLAIDYGTETQKPPYSYAQLIVQAVSTCPDRQLTLNGIYNYISKHYPYFKSHDKGWQNSVRHNLSLNRYFLKVPRAQDEPGKGSFWRIDAAYEGKLITQAFRKRRLRNNGACITNDHLGVSQGPRMVAMATSGRTSNVYAISDRSTKLGTLYTVKRTDQKTAFVVKKMNELSAVSQKFISVMNGTASQSVNVEKKISVLTAPGTNHSVFHSVTQTAIRPLAQKRLYPSSLRIVNESTSLSSCTSSSSSCSNNTTTTTTNMAAQGTLFNIDGTLYTASTALNSIQVISGHSTDSLSLVPVAKQQSTRNKYILISSSLRAQQSPHRAPSVCITGSGSLRGPSVHIRGHNSSSTTTHTSNSTDSVHTVHHDSDRHAGLSPEDRGVHIALSHCSSSDMAPLPQSPITKYPSSMDLDFDTDQFLVSSPIMDHNGDLDTSPDLYNVDDDDDAVMWQDSLCFHDVEIEGH